MLKKKWFIYTFLPQFGNEFNKSSVTCQILMHQKCFLKKNMEGMQIMVKKMKHFADYNSPLELLSTARNKQTIALQAAG